MNLRILQLNIYGCMYFDNFKNFLQTHTYDVLHLQEVRGKGKILKTIDFPLDSLPALKKLLGNSYQQVFVQTTHFTQKKLSPDGNASFIAAKFPIIEQKIMWLRKNEQPFHQTPQDISTLGAALIVCKVLVGEKPLWLLNTHLGWSPTSADTEEKEKQSSIIAAFLETLTEPFILTGDFNADSSTNTIKMLEQYGRNLATKNHVSNTLNPRLHRTQHLFPKGLVVDFIFVSKDLGVKDFAVLEDDISDHLGLAATIEI